jgi:NAD(P)-dependent dehydrogenase (short-subunit alcohol dehydrogenase family)
MIDPIFRKEVTMELQGTVSLVTGAGAGIGAATALRLAREGSAVVVADVDTTMGRDLVRAIENEGALATFVQADVKSEPEVRAMVDHAEASFGGLDVLVNNAGGVEPPYFPEAEPSHWERALDLNLRGVMLCIHFGIRAMRRRGGGAVVNISSMGGVGFQSYDKPEYGASKAGVIRLTASLASLQETIGVRVNCICPGGVNTPAMQRTLAGMTQAEREQAQTRPILQPEDIADAVVMFAKDDTMAGRVMLWQEGEPWQLIPADTPF